jgi:hypothetical protein
MLETNAYVRCLCLVSSKAFDRVDHDVLIDRLSIIELSL